MRDAHLTAETLRELFDRDNDESSIRLLLHHLAVCPACGAVGGYILRLYESGALPPVFGLVDLDLAHSRAEAPALLGELLGTPPARQEDLLRQEERFRSWGLAELLCRESERAAGDDAARALRLAELAVVVAWELEEGKPAEAAWLLELRAFALANLGNARRVAGDLPKAARAFARAGELWAVVEPGVGDVFGYEARILALEASLRLAERRFPEALALLDRAIEVNADPELAGALMLSQARVFEETGELDRSIAILLAAGDLVDRGRSPRLYLCLRHNLVDNLARASRWSEARALLPELQELSQAHGGGLDRTRLLWVEGRIAAGLGEHEAAITLLEEARQALSSREISYDAALVSLELATVYLGAGRTAKVKALAEEMLPIFEASEVHREAVAALAVFHHAASTETLTLALARRIASYLERARHDPGLHFDEEG